MPILGTEWIRRSNKVDYDLLRFVAYLAEKFPASTLQWPLLRRDVLRGWQLRGNVPFGYGLGSSGTVCAAIWDRYAGLNSKTIKGKALQATLGKMEAFFHGQSSGTDPLISLLNAPVLISKGGIEPIELPNEWQAPFFLLDTGISRKSGPLIQRFLQRYDTDFAWQIAVKECWGSCGERCIDALLDGELATLQVAFSALSMYQGAIAREWIPYPFHRIWRGSSYRLKICGAGGGGFLLGYSFNWSATQEELRDFRLVKL
ncbi:MAG: mevalonate kinase [Bacteroidota bacterium]